MRFHRLFILTLLLLLIIPGFRAASAATGTFTLGVVSSVTEPVLAIQFARNNISVKVGEIAVSKVDGDDPFFSPAYFTMFLFAGDWLVRFDTDRFDLYLAKTPHSVIAASDQVYAEGFLVEDLNADYPKRVTISGPLLKGGRADFYLGTLVHGGVTYKVLVGPLPLEIGKGYPYVKIFDGDYHAVAVSIQRVELLPNLVLNPERGPVGTSVTAHAYLFPPTIGVEIWWYGNYKPPKFVIASGQTGEDGKFVSPVSFTIPRDYGCSHRIEATRAGTDVVITDTAFSITPSLHVSPHEVRNDGSLFEVVGMGFKLDKIYEAVIDNFIAYPRHLRASATGDLILRIVAAGFRPGLHVVSVYEREHIGVGEPVAHATFIVLTEGDAPVETLISEIRRAETEILEEVRRMAASIIAVVELSSHIAERLDLLEAALRSELERFEGAVLGALLEGRDVLLDALTRVRKEILEAIARSSYVLIKEMRDTVLGAISDVKDTVSSARAEIARLLTAAHAELIEGISGVKKDLGALSKTMSESAAMLREIGIGIREDLLKFSHEAMKSLDRTIASIGELGERKLTVHFTRMNATIIAASDKIVATVRNVSAITAEDINIQGVRIEEAVMRARGALSAEIEGVARDLISYFVVIAALTAAILGIQLYAMRRRHV